LALDPGQGLGSSGRSRPERSARRLYGCRRRLDRGCRPRAAGGRCASGQRDRRRQSQDAAAL